MEGSAGCQVRWLLDERDGAPTFAMRQFEVAPGGHTPQHFHDYEHEVFVLEGTGVVLEGGREHPSTGWRRGARQAERSSSVSQPRPHAAQVSLPHPQLGDRQVVTVAPECGIRD